MDFEGIMRELALKALGIVPLALVILEFSGQRLTKTSELQQKKDL